MLTQKERRTAEAIEHAIARDDWLRARRLVHAALSRKADDHWLLSRLALTYYERRQYRRALTYDLKALQIEPYCPLAIWGYAGALAMLERHKEALKIYRWLISWGENELAYGPCGEGIQRARSLIADCFYRIARIQEQMGQRKRALQSYNEHLSRRNRGTRSILKTQPLAVATVLKIGKGGIRAVAVDHRNGVVRLVGFWNGRWHNMKYDDQHPGKWSKWKD